MHVHVGDAQIVVGHHQVIVEDDVQIQSSRAPMNDSLPTGFRLDAVKLIQKFMWGEQGGNSSGTVQEGRLEIGRAHV